MIRWLCSRNRVKLFKAGKLVDKDGKPCQLDDIKNASEYEVFRMACRAARKATKGGDRYEVLRPLHRGK